MAFSAFMPIAPSLPMPVKIAATTLALGHSAMERNITSTAGRQ